MFVIYDSPLSFMRHTVFTYAIQREDRFHTPHREHITHATHKDIQRGEGRLITSLNTYREGGKEERLVRLTRRVSDLGPTRFGVGTSCLGPDLEKDSHFIFDLVKSLFQGPLP